MYSSFGVLPLETPNPLFEYAFRASEPSLQKNQPPSIPCSIFVTSAFQRCWLDGSSCVSLVGQKALGTFQATRHPRHACVTFEITLQAKKSSASLHHGLTRQDTDGAAAGEALTASSESGSAALPSSCLTLAQPVYTAGFKLLPQLRQPQSPLLAHVLLDTGSASLPQGNRKNSLLAAEEEVRRAWANKSAAPSVN